MTWTAALSDADGAKEETITVEMAILQKGEEGDTHTYAFTVDVAGHTVFSKKQSVEF